MSTKIITIPTDDPRLGRHVEHDELSRRFAMSVPIDKSTWVDKRNRIYDPTPNPNQSVGNCTMCAKAMQLNTVGNRTAGVRLDMAWAMNTYSWETANDEFDGAFPPDDTGSSGLASCKTAQQFGVGGAYRWLFGGADEVVANIMAGKTINVGTYWYDDMFEGFKHYYSMPVIKPGGSIAGGHEWSVRGYSVVTDRILGRCWWGPPDASLDVHRDFWMARGDLQDLLMDDGDAHWQAHA